MIDLHVEKPIRLRDARSLFGERRGGALVSLATLYKWVRDGSNGTHLEILKVGGMTFTTAEAIERFIAGCSAASSGDRPGSAGAAETARRRSRRAVQAAAAARAALHPEPKRAGRKAAAAK